MSSHDDKMSRVHDYLDERMSADDRVSFEREMANNESLASEVSRHRTLRDALRADPTAEPLGDAFYARAREEFESPTSRRSSPWPYVGLAVAAGLVLVLFGPQLVQPPESPQPSTTVATESAKEKLAEEDAEGDAEGMMRLEQRAPEAKRQQKDLAKKRSVDSRDADVGVAEMMDVAAPQVNGVIIEASMIGPDEIRVVQQEDSRSLLIGRNHLRHGCGSFTWTVEGDEIVVRAIPMAGADVLVADGCSIPLPLDERPIRLVDPRDE
ncbi:MAG: hypothetical protein OEV00_16170 [Acidobacteriota bacterium]|nr:hypothetical protein [Acidobacteriota bacterium]MDH3786848.1 hypothetical protein [Acidobacteriota bacterium]